VAQAAVVMIRDGEMKAFVVPAKGGMADVSLARELQDFVAARRAVHEVPRRVEFVKELPSRDDGSVAREDLLSMPLRLDAPSPEDRLPYRLS
jgi:acetyl-CoA synthetase